MEKEILIFGHKNPDTDTICSSMVKEILNTKNGKNNSKAVRLGPVNKETQFVLDYLGIEAPELIEKVKEGQKVIMVDHNEFSQSVDGIENAQIIGVVDHHKIGNFQTSEPLYFTCRPYGCTSTILYLDFLEKGIEIEKTEAILMLSAIISDTLLKKSPTTTKKDIKALDELAKIAGIDIETYGLDLLKAGTDLGDLSEKQLINLDAKELVKNGTKFIIAQINAIDINEILKRKDAIEIEIEKEIKVKELQFFVLAITDILNSNSEVIVLGEKSSIVEKAFNKTLKDNQMFLEGVVSRKKQLLPVIDRII